MEAKTVKSNMTDMTQGSPAGLILFFALPLLVGNMFQQLYNMVDSIVVGRFVGSTALAAVGTAFPAGISGRRAKPGEEYASKLPRYINPATAIRQQSGDGANRASGGA